ncbi:MAG TPA: regulatory protein RecX [Smithellaceae bacterium]|nr:regulatory protein RecX [Smithellaceae bacterium]HNQ17621.1 regulatory protein RecX [Smithellaceae bacterium]HNT91958.1 regulatory protein RecX [Smithellaceae bacterium]HNZ31525.1 regulatory protein RecX [Smithellaceae bacterium]HPG54226.1 regulatory protein RecX [Smithellaceae bacterium]
MKAFNAAAAQQKAYRLLSLRPRSEKELKKKLREKGFSPPVVEEVLEKLRELKYLDDESFARQWARNLAVNKLWGNKKIILSLREKGIEGDLIGEAVEKARQEISEEEAAEFLVNKKKSVKKGPELSPQKEKQRIFQSLLRRGFPAGLILQKLGNIAQGDFDSDDG